MRPYHAKSQSDHRDRNAVRPARLGRPHPLESGGQLGQSGRARSEGSAGDSRRAGVQRLPGVQRRQAVRHAGADGGEVAVEAVEPSRWTAWWPIRSRFWFLGWNKKPTDVAPGGGLWAAEWWQEILRARAVLSRLDCVATVTKFLLSLLARCPFLILPSPVTCFHCLFHISIIHPRLRLVSQLDLLQRHVPVNDRVPHCSPGRPLVSGAGSAVHSRPISDEQVQTERVLVQVARGAHGDGGGLAARLHAADRDGDKIMVADVAWCYISSRGEVRVTSNDVVDQSWSHSRTSGRGYELAERQTIQQLLVRSHSRLGWLHDVEVSISEDKHWRTFCHDVRELVMQIVDGRYQRFSRWPIDGADDELCPARQPQPQRLKRRASTGDVQQRGGDAVVVDDRNSSAAAADSVLPNDGVAGEQESAAVHRLRQPAFTLADGSWLTETAASAAVFLLFAKHRRGGVQTPPPPAGRRLSLRSHVRSRSGQGSTTGVLKFWTLGTRNIDSQYSN